MSEIRPPLRPDPPFIWPEPRILEGMTFYEEQPPFAAAARAADSVFGIVSSLRGKGIAAVNSWLTNKKDFTCSLIVAVYPTCLTHTSDLELIRQMAEQYGERLTVHIYVCRSVIDRPTNCLCFWEKSSGIFHSALGPSENLGLDPSREGQVNFYFKADVVLVEYFKRYFMWLWTNSQNISEDGVTQIPDLVLPEGAEEAARQWEEYHEACSTVADEASGKVQVIVDPKTGEVSIPKTEGEDIPSPTEKLGIPKLDPVALEIARLYEKGMLVSIDKLSRIPPLDAPLDPRWFGDVSELQKGNVTRKVSMRISIIDEKTLKEIDKRRHAIRTLLGRFTFGLADNMRWMPQSAQVLFEAELDRVNAEGQKLIADLLKGDVDSFIKAKKDTLIADINGMHKELGRQGEVTDDIIERVVTGLTERLNKAQTGSFMPKLTYSTITFSATDNAWASPWGQVFSLLFDIAGFPRKALTDSFFFRGLKVSEDDLIEAMDVANDAIVRSMATRGIKDRCKVELDLITQIEGASIDMHDKCGLIWKIIKGVQVDEIAKECNAIEKEQKKREINR